MTRGRRLSGQVNIQQLLMNTAYPIIGESIVILIIRDVILELIVRTIRGRRAHGQGRVGERRGLGGGKC